MRNMFVKLSYTLKRKGHLWDQLDTAAHAATFSGYTTNVLTDHLPEPRKPRLKTQMKLTVKLIGPDQGEFQSD